jgi:hypothetical protein
VIADRFAFGDAPKAFDAIKAAATATVTETGAFFSFGYHRRGATYGTGIELCRRGSWRDGF